MVHERAGLPLKSAVEGGHCGVVSERGEVRQEVGVEHEGNGGAIKEGEGEMSQGGNGAMKSDGRREASSFPIERQDI